MQPYLGDQHCLICNTTFNNGSSIDLYFWILSQTLFLIRQQRKVQSGFQPQIQSQFNSRSKRKKWYFVTKIFLTCCEKKCFSDRENNLKFEAEGQEFAKTLQSLEQFVQTVKGQNNFW